MSDTPPLPTPIDLGEVRRRDQLKGLLADSIEAARTGNLDGMIDTMTAFVHETEPKNAEDANLAAVCERFIEDLTALLVKSSWTSRSKIAWIIGQVAHANSTMSTPLVGTPLVGGSFRPYP